MEFIKYLLEEIIKSRRAYCGGEELVLVVFMLFQFGRVEDVFQIYAAKFSGGMDSVIAVDTALLLGAGLKDTIKYLNEIGTDKAMQIIDVIETYHNPSTSLEKYTKIMKDYYEVLNE